MRKVDTDAIKANNKKSAGIYAAASTGAAAVLAYIFKQRFMKKSVREYNFDGDDLFHRV